MFPFVLVSANGGLSLAIAPDIVVVDWCSKMLDRNRLEKKTRFGATSNSVSCVGITDPTNQVISNRFGSGHTHSDDYKGKSVLFAVPE